jgi:LacI family transcriptional regulator
MAANRATIKDVAQASGVALGTASRVINRKGKVAQATREKVEAVIAQLGYEPHQLAQSIRRGSTHTIGIMVRDITVPAFAGFVRSAQETLQQAGYVLLITSSENQKERELDILRLLDRQRVDGLIMNTAIEDDPALSAARIDMRVPIVMIDRDNIAPADSVLLTHYDGMRQALQFLFSLGHRRIGLVTGNHTVYAGRERIRAYRDAHSAHEIPFDPNLVRAKDFSGESAFQETLKLLKMPKRPTALIAGGIAMLGGTLQAIQACGLSVPGDISLIGSADSELAQLSVPPITVVRGDYARLGETSALLLLDHLNGTPVSAPRNIVQPTEFVIRGSCAAPPKTGKR